MTKKLTNTKLTRLLATFFESCEVQDTPNGWVAVEQKYLGLAAKHLRGLADRVDVVERMRPAAIANTANHTINHTGTVAVSTQRRWLFITPETPRGVMLNLLTTHGVSTKGILTANNLAHFRGWEPMARIPHGMIT